MHTALANSGDRAQTLPAVADVPRVPGKCCRPRSHPDVLVVDRGYDGEATRSTLRAQGIEPVIARRGEDHGSSLGWLRRVVGRMIGRLKEFPAFASDATNLFPFRRLGTRQPQRSFPS